MRLRGVRTVIRLLLLIVMVYAFLMLLSVRGRLTAARAELEGTRKRAEMLQQQNQELRSSIDGESVEETMERLARERLGLVRPGDEETYRAGD